MRGWDNVKSRLLISKDALRGMKKGIKTSPSKQDPRLESTA
tara:strand:- start:106 stop:228 length:123 start_codon:yes stop_codon:yes gene_type:complete